MGWVSILDPAAVAATLDIPATWTFIGYLCLGFPETEDDIPDLERAGLGAAISRILARCPAALALASPFHVTRMKDEAEPGEQDAAIDRTHPSCNAAVCPGKRLGAGQPASVFCAQSGGKSEIRRGPAANTVCAGSRWTRRQRVVLLPVRCTGGERAREQA
jgi:putative hemolysin